MLHSQSLRLPAVIPPGLTVAVGLMVAIPLGITIAQGSGTVGLAVVLGAWLYCFIGFRWQRGFYGLLMYLPFAGVVTLALYPWKATLLFKDLFFLVPAYIGFFTRLAVGQESLSGLPRVPVGLMIALSILALVGLAPAGGGNLQMGLIGLKVWLLYFPLFFLSFVCVETERDLFLLLRLLAILAFIPAAVGIAEAILANLGGYQTVMESFYGEMAPQTTQGFAQFSVGEGTLARIPSTFPFVTQYFGYTLTMLPVCYALGRGAPFLWWRSLGRGMLVLVAVASFLSGARSAFVFTPLLLILMFAFERGFSGFVPSGTYIVGPLFTALAILGIGTVALYRHISTLFVSYAGDVAYGGLAEALHLTFWGVGTGTGTGAARYALTDPDSFRAIENYYAKAAYELGLPGLLVVVGLFVSIVWLGLLSHRRLQDPLLRSASAGFLAFFVMMMLNNFKGWQIDLDPVNVYFWVFAGILMKLPILDRSTSSTEQFSRQQQQPLPELSGCM